jgi:hypothetical protein
MYFVEKLNKESNNPSKRARQFAGPAFVKRYRKRKGGYRQTPEPKSANNCLPSRKQLVESMRIWDAQQALDTLFEEKLDSRLEKTVNPQKQLPEQSMEMSSKAPLTAVVDLSAETLLVNLPAELMPEKTHNCWQEDANWRYYKRLCAS